MVYYTTCCQRVTSKTPSCSLDHPWCLRHELLDLGLRRSLLLQLSTYTPYVLLPSGVTTNNTVCRHKYELHSSKLPVDFAQTDGATKR